MKKSAFLLLLLLFPVVCHSQDFTNKIKAVSYEINNVPGDDAKFAIRLQFELADDSHFTKDCDQFDQSVTNSIMPPVTFIVNGEPVSGLTSTFMTSQVENAFYINFTNITPELIETILNKEAKFVINSPIVFDICVKEEDGAITTVQYRVEPAYFNEVILSSDATLTADEKAELVASLGKEHSIYQNEIDFGYQLNEEGETNENFYLSFNLRNSYKVGDGFSYHYKGYVSTNSQDSINFLALYPLSWYKFNPEKISQTYFSIGIEANQRFDYSRLVGTATKDLLIPFNPIDLSFGFNRLQLKPVVSGGIKLYQEISSNTLLEGEELEGSIQLTGELYYYIPIANVYSLKLALNGFYDLNDEIDHEKQFGLLYQAAFLLEIPNSKIQTIFEYRKGENGITYQHDEIISIGIIAGLLNHLNKK